MQCCRAHCLGVPVHCLSCQVAVFAARRQVHMHTQPHIWSPYYIYLQHHVDKHTHTPLFLLLLPCPVCTHVSHAQVAEAVEAVTDAAGTFISCRAAHMCMVARGVENHGGTTVSTAARGVFNTSASLRLTCLKEAQRQQAAFACQHGLASKACGSNKGPLLCRHHHNSAATQ